VRLPHGRTFKGTSSTVMMDGVSTYLALTFGTLLSSQGTDASFVLTRSDIYWGFPPGASLRCFQPYQIRFPFRFRFGIRFRLPVGAGFRLYQKFSARRSSAFSSERVGALRYESIFIDVHWPKLVRY
ncbi:hypothetical protein, partial [Streptomyces luteosporeus]|uniref:hypothetical protein n=1 Tax=Streptomyces luteosporeus TaxID=173856 RepID=UPI0031D8A3A9